MEPSTERPGVTRSLSGSAPALAVTIEREQWDNFRHEALILEVQLRVENLARIEKKLVAWRVDINSPGSTAGMMSHPDVLREVQRRRGIRHAGFERVLQPGDSVKGWLVFAFPWRAEPGSPDYSITVLDELKVEYEARR